ncbi:hypothetical protein COU60_01385 [Candidatus Pacearchaeota archaeon CG10_big_fil_rev_8_21_14_0_10_34_76]|nr:MAG: hypothetical protein COU60_01385 [Candidatus Pacearchaeota archaeon CG10_big_fil_rev_8_21_14_0_10_34_76]
MKPAKTLYPNQEEIHKRILSFIETQLVPEVSEAYLTGSVVRREFGRYVEEYHGHNGSDIDLVVMINKEYIPKAWKNLNTEKTWFDLYSGGKIEIEGIYHQLDLLVVKEGMESFAVQRMNDLGWIVEKVR